ncbi:hypothetical protein BG006_009160 [Podila minutissima]|uniref:Uncharacterized protein n=1 Tax=Podila minutissima TaxID=64525 RepID=A0A9P5SEY4_9FUNG|nr:hypothetical protein BG006_009160 [Podila minutissima]
MSTTVEQIEDVKSRIADLAREIMIANNGMNHENVRIGKANGFIEQGRNSITTEGIAVLKLREKSRQILLSSDKALLEWHEKVRNQKLEELAPLKAELQQAEDELRALEALLEGKNSQA